MVSRHLVARSVVAAFAGMLLHAALHAQTAPDLDKARQLIRDGKAGEAYSLLEPRAEALSRDRDANYLLGVAALDSGHPGVAQMALERALILDPNFLPARAELGRAYLQLGDLDGARRELDVVRSANPPDDVRQSVDRLIAATDAEGKAGGTGFKVSGYLSAEAGYDDNINAATNSTVVNLPVFGNLPFTLSPLFTAQHSSFAGVGGGVAITAPISERASVFATGDIKGRDNFQQSAYAPAIYGALGGVQYVNGADRVNVGLNLSGYRVSSLELDRRKGIFASWSRDLSARDRVSAFGQYLDNTYPQDRSQDTQTYLVGGVWMHGFEGAGAPTIGATVFGANEPQRSSDETVGRKFVGFRLTGDYRTREDLRLVGGFSHVYSRYGGVSAIFLTKRIEKRYDFDIGLAWTPARLWTITPQLIYTRNDSTTAVSDFSRTQVLISARRDFD